MPDQPTTAAALTIIERRIESNRQADALRKWVLYGDMSTVDEPHYSAIQRWEASERLSGRSICE